MKKEDVKKLCIVDKKGFCKCRKCKSDILVVTVSRPVWDFPEACAGSGEVRHEEVPYCPKCEKKPDSRGAPIMER